tara:strand:- start:37 stop:336 length:300 start_codon:yes stop_codon:yes gene_type:complete
MQLINLIIFANFFILQGTNSIFISGINAQSSKIRIDDSLEKLEEAITNKNKKIICLESKKSIKIIVKNQNKLKKLEPYYDWDAIKKVLHLKVKMHCQNQ